MVESAGAWLMGVPLIDIADRLPHAEASYLAANRWEANSLNSLHPPTIANLLSGNGHPSLTQARRTNLALTKVCRTLADGDDAGFPNLLGPRVKSRIRSLEPRFLVADLAQPFSAKSCV